MLKENLLDTVISNDYCIGCGACSAVDKSFKIALDEFGMYKAKYLNESGIVSTDLASKVCPFSNYSRNEDEISEILFPQIENKNKYLGKYLKNYVGYVTEGDFRQKGSSGGFAKWTLNELLQNGHVDYVIQVVNKNELDELFTFEVFKKGDDILTGSKSAYYPITLEGVFEFIKNHEGRYAVTSIPCFSKALRSIAMLDPIIGERVRFVIGIICGHLKSTGFAESLGWQLGVEPKSLRGIEFRGKIEGLRANEKGVYAIDENNNKSRVSSSRELLGGNWGHNFFKYKACDYCDDVVGETTDMSVGDAWLEDLMSDHNGNSVLVVRNPVIAALIQKAVDENRVSILEVSEDIIIKSQAGGIRHRREGLSYRLYRKEKLNEWVPKKRVAANKNIRTDRKKTYEIREDIRDISHKVFKEAKDKNDLSLFMNTMLKEVERFEPTFFEMAFQKAKNIIKKMIGRKKVL